MRAFRSVIGATPLHAGSKYLHAWAAAAHAPQDIDVRCYHTKKNFHTKTTVCASEEAAVIKCDGVRRLDIRKVQGAGTLISRDSSW